MKRIRLTNEQETDLIKQKLQSLMCSLTSVYDVLESGDRGMERHMLDTIKAVELEILRIRLFIEMNWS